MGRGIQLHVYVTCVRARFGCGAAADESIIFLYFYYISEVVIASW